MNASASPGPTATGGTRPRTHGRLPIRVSAISASAVRSPVPIVPVMCTAGRASVRSACSSASGNCGLMPLPPGGELVEPDQHRRPGRAGVETLSHPGRVAQQEAQVVAARLGGPDQRVPVGPDAGGPPVDGAGGARGMCRLMSAPDALPRPGVHGDGRPPLRPPARRPSSVRAAPSTRMRVPSVIGRLSRAERRLGLARRPSGHAGSPRLPLPALGEAGQPPCGGPADVVSHPSFSKIAINGRTCRAGHAVRRARKVGSAWWKCARTRPSRRSPAARNAERRR